jgi:thioredoxin reductase (NADPH)
MNSAVECLIIGGGPAGLTAATYLARFRRNALVIDSRKSRAELIPSTHNYPAFADGISGPELLENLRKHASQYGARLRTGSVERLERDGDIFVATLDDGTIVHAPKTIVAAGIVDEKPNLPGMPEFIYRGRVRFCPICDGYEAIDHRIAVIGPLLHAAKKAMFLRTYSRHVCVLPLEQFRGDDEVVRLLEDAEIELPQHPVADLICDGELIKAIMTNGDRIEADVLYPAMGCYVRSTLAVRLGARHQENGCIVTDDSQLTNIPGLYAIGDVTTELHQLSVAVGQAAIAATHVHNNLPPNRC